MPIKKQMTIKNKLRPFSLKTTVFAKYISYFQIIKHYKVFIVESIRRLLSCPYLLRSRIINNERDSYRQEHHMKALSITSNDVESNLYNSNILRALL